MPDQVDPKPANPMTAENENSPLDASQLDAKLHQGYDPNTEFKEKGNLFSTIDFAEEQRKTHYNFFFDLLNNVASLFDRMLGDFLNDQQKENRIDQAGRETQNAAIISEINNASSSDSNGAIVSDDRFAGNNNSSHSSDAGDNFNPSTTVQALSTVPDQLFFIDAEKGTADVSDHSDDGNNSSGGTDGENQGVSTFRGGTGRVNAINNPAAESSGYGSTDGTGSGTGGGTGSGASGGTGSGTGGGTGSGTGGGTGSGTGGGNNPAAPHTPILTLSASIGLEGHSIALNVSLTADPSASTTLVISGVPVGATLSAGVHNPDGTWTVDPSQLPGLTMTPPAGSSGLIDLDISVTSTLNGLSASANGSVGVTIEGAASMPTLSVQAGAGLEDTAIPLIINAVLTDTSGSEVLSITVSDVPVGAILSAGIDNHDGTWTLTAGQLAGLTITPPADFYGNISLTVTATSSENGTSESISAPLNVTVTGVADAPVLSLPGTVTGVENHAIGLSIGLTINPSETATIIITGVPAGATLSAGVHNPDGSWTLNPGDLNGLVLNPPPYFSGNINLNVTATASEHGASSSATGALNVAVSGEATTPLLSVNAAAGLEGTAIPLVIHAALVDTDGSETLSIIVSGLPAGGSLSAGVNNNDGTWTLTPGQLTGLTFTPPANASGDYTLHITATSSENGTSASIAADLGVHVAGVAGTPILSVQAGLGAEDSTIQLHITADIDDHDGSEDLSVKITGIPAGGVLSAGIQNSDGSWTLTPAQLAGLTLTPPLHFSGNLSLTVTATSSEEGTTASASANLGVTVTTIALPPVLNVQASTGLEDHAIALNIGANLAVADSESLSITIGNVPNGATLSAGINNGNGSWTLTPAQLTGLTITPPLHYSGTLNLDVTAETSANGTSASTHSNLGITVAGVATTPLLSVQAAVGVEDTPIALAISAALVDTDGSETLTVTVSGVPTGATLSAGVRNADGTWTLGASDLTGLTLTPPAHFSGNINLDVTATSSENGTTADVHANLGVTVTGVATTPLLSVQAAAGLEDTIIPLVINAALADTDGSETLAVTIGGVPIGATLSAGVHNPDGTWTLSASDLSGLTLTPPAYFSGNINLNVTATSSENGTTATANAGLSVSIAGVATTPLLTLHAATGLEDNAIPLAVNAALVDTDGSETLAIQISGVPVGASLSAGIHNPDGSWTLTPSQLTGLTFTPPANASGDYTLHVTATSSENNTSASVSGDLGIHVSGVADTPILTVHAASGLEDHVIALNISASTPDTDGSETLSINISGIPVGSYLSAGVRNADFSYTLTPSELVGLTLRPPQYYSGSLNLVVTATSSEDGTSASTTLNMPVNIEGVATTPTLSVHAAAGLEDTQIALTIGAALVDLDGSETLSINIAGVPAGATLSAGVHNPDGTWTLSAANLTGLTLTPPLHFSGDIHLDVTATSSENNTVASISAGLDVTVTGVATVPILNVLPVIGLEDTAITLPITAALADIDGSETLTVTIAGLPVNATLSAGVHNSDGTWTLTAAQMAGLTLTPPANFSGDINLTVTATSSENGTTASISAALPVHVSGVADLPTLSVHAAVGLQDTAIALNIAAALTDTDGSETLTITVHGMPVGAILSAGTHNPDGSWTLTPGQLTGLTFTPPSQVSGDINLSIIATSSEDGTSASVTATLPIAVHGLVLPPILSITAGVGLEDTPIALPITAGLDIGVIGTLGLTVSGLPIGATLSAGVNNHDGTWSLSTADLAHLTITPPANYSGTFNLSLTATATVAGALGGIAVTTATLPVTVSGVADVPTLTLHAANGNEDTPILLNIGAALTDTDGSETLSVTVSGLPVGATLSAGTHNPDGSWTLTAAQLTGLSMTPPANASGDYTLHVTATSSENGTTANISGDMSVHVAGIADTPIVIVQPASGLESGAIALHITATTVDTDGSESMSILLTNVPAGAILSAGVNNNNGTWTLTPAQLNGLTITPPVNYTGILALGVTATSSEEGTMATTSVTLPVAVAGIAHIPTLGVQAATGLEDHAIALSISSAITGSDGLEHLALTISGVPAGAILSAGTHNPDGTWTLSTGDLTGLTLTPPANFSGSINLGVTATSTENGTTATATTTLGVTVTGVADAPLLSVQTATGNEDTPIALTITPSFVDADGSETMSVTISGLPGGATLSTGTHNPDGSWTLTQAQLAGLTLIPGANWSGTADLNVTATTSEAGTTASTSATLHLNVAGVADTPTLSVHAVTGLEDTPVLLGINAALTDTDGSETLSVIIGSLPAGATLSAGVHNPDGTWTLTSAQLAGLTLTPPANFSGALSLSITAVSSENGTTATTSATLPVTITGVADAPSLSVHAVSGNADSAIALNIVAALTDTDGSETLSISILGVPAGATLSAGTHNPDGSWTLTQAQLSGLTLTPPTHWNGTLALDVTATSSEDGTTAATTAVLPVTVMGIAIPPLLTVNAATGNEDTPIALNIAAALANVDPLETLSVTISNLPAGATLSAGTHNPDGSWTLVPAQLAGLTMTPPSNASGDYTLHVMAVASENGSTAGVTKNLSVHVAGVADTPTISVQAAAGNEDTAIPLVINAALTDTDGSETLSIRISGLPVGATLSAGIHNSDGSYTLTPAQLTGLILTPPANWSGAADLNVTATSSEEGTTASASTALHLTVAGVADAPALSVHAVSGFEDTPVLLNIVAALTDTDGSETLAVTIGNMPAGATLSAGTHNPDGTWTLTPAQLTGLTMTPPLHASGSYNLSIAATSSENGTTATTTGNLPVSIAGVATTPVGYVLGASGAEDTAIPLTIHAALADTDGSETLSVTISGMPVGATLSAGTKNSDGTWTLTPAQLTGLSLTPPSHYSGSFNLTVTETSSENGTTASADVTLPVTVTGIATMPKLTLGTASGLEGANISLPITAALNDTDGSETLSIRVSGIPSGMALSAGTNNGDGSYTLSAAQLSGLSLSAPAHFSGSFALTVTATSSENGTTANLSQSMPVTIGAVASTPTLSVTGTVNGNEDTAIPLTIAAALTDTDGSEKLGITISGVPAGAVLSAGSYAGNGLWSLTTADLAGLKITPPANFSGVIALNVSAISYETSNGDAARLSAPISVNVAGVADKPNLTVAAATGFEDTSIPLSISSSLMDTDGSEKLSITISGLPTGATLSAGINNGNGSYTLTAAQLAGLSLMPPANSNTGFTLTVTATSTELSNGSNASQSATIPVSVTGVADTPPSVSVSNSTGVVNTAIPVSITSTGLTADRDGSETVSYVISGVPDGFAFNHGINNGNNTWTLTQSDLSGLTMVSPYNFEGRVNMAVQSVSSENDGGLSASSAVNFNVGVGNASGGIQLNLNLGIGAAGIGANIGVGVTLNTSILGTGMVVLEDSTVLLSDAPNLLGLVVGTISYFTISGLPTGATLSAGTNMGGGTWNLATAQLYNLSLTLPKDSDQDFTLTAQVKLLGLLPLTLGVVPVHVVGVADIPNLSVTAATGTEHGGPIPIAVTTSSGDTDGSEIMTYLIRDLPTGFAPTSGIHNPDGSYSLTAAQIASLAIQAPSGFSGDATFTIVAIATEKTLVASDPEGDSTKTSVTAYIHVNPVADAPIISATTQNGTEDHALALNLGISLPVADVNEHISAVTISGLPSGATLTGATDNHNGTWSADVAHLDQVKFIPAANWSGDVNLTVTATGQEGLTGPTSSTTATLPIHIEAIADTPLSTATDSTGTADTAINLHVASVNTGSNEHLSAVISGLPSGATLSAGVDNGDGTWTLTPTQLANLTIMPPAHFSGDISLSLTSYAQETNGSVASSHQDFAVHVLPGTPNVVDNSTTSWMTDGHGGSSAAGSTHPFDLTTVVPPPSSGDHELAFQNH